MTDRQLQYGRATLAAPPGESGPIQFVASSPAVNRYGFSLRPTGWRLDNYAANPVVLWAHDADRPPIGRAATTIDGALLAAIEFDQADPFAQSIEGKYRRGYLGAVSVGFDFVDDKGEQLDWWTLKPETIREEAFYDLAEISAVPVPADPKALVKQSRLARLELGRELLSMLAGQVPSGDDLAGLIRAEVQAALAGTTPEPAPAPASIVVPTTAVEHLLAATKL